MTTATKQGTTLMTGLTANDLTRSLKLYVDGLGFEIVERYERDGKLGGAMLKLGNAGLGVSQDDFAKGKDRVKGIGMSMYLETDQDLASLAQRVKDNGFQLAQDLAPLPWGPMAFTVVDPDGFKLIVASPR